MKYFVLGALASGFLLYGLSMMYGATGSLDIPEVFKAIASGRINKSVLAFGLVFVVSGLAFKLGAVPFHMWVPDVYQGAPTAVTLLVAGAPKLAAFAITFRLLVEGLSGLALDWQQMLDRALGGLDGDRQPGRDRADQPEAHARLLDDRADGLHAARLHADGGVVEHLLGGQRLQLGDVLRRHLRVHDAGHLRHHPAAVAPRPRGRTDRRPEGPRPAQPLVCRRDGDLHVLARRHPADGRLLRQAGGAAGDRHHQRHRLHRAGRRGGAVLADRRLLLHPRRQGHVLRRAGRPCADRRQHRGAHAALAQRRRGAAVRAAARRADGAVRAGGRQGARRPDATHAEPPRPPRS